MKTIFKNREQVRIWYLKKYKKGTEKEIIKKNEDIVHDDNEVWKVIDAPNLVGSRHFVDKNGDQKSSEVKQSWMIVFEFNNEGKLKNIDVHLVTR